MRKKKNLKKAEKLIMEMPQPQRSIFIHKLLIASGIIKLKRITKITPEQFYELDEMEQAEVIYLPKN